jgi:putative (di)nucleoside polyphosphate hydrolase
MSTEKPYRPNSAVIVTDGNGRVLLCERADLPGAIQTVQGGIDAGETALQAAHRELHEEIGLSDSKFRIVASLPDPYRYDWPKEILAQLEPNDAFWQYRGQEQYFFLAQTPPDATFRLDGHGQEFSRVWWGTPQEMIAGAWEYKRAILKDALKKFGLLTQNS